MADQASEKVVVSSKQSSLNTETRKKLLIVMGIIVLVIIGLLVYSYFKDRNNVKLSESQLISKTETYMASNNYKAAVSLINSQPTSVKNSNTNKQILANAYAAEGNYKSALQVYSSLNKSNLGMGVDQSIALVAVKAKNTQQAIYWYQQAEKASTSDPLGASYRQSFQSAINQLQAKK